MGRKLSLQALLSVPLFQYALYRGWDYMVFKVHSNLLTFYDLKIIKIDFKSPNFRIEKELLSQSLDQVDLSPTNLLVLHVICSLKT